MQTNPLNAVLFTLMKTGLEAVGSRLPVETDGDCIYLRNLLVIVNDLGEIQCYDVNDPDRPLMTFPMDALQAAATKVVVHVLQGIIARAVEADDISALA
ncbi:hypothetical protein [Rhizobium leguminosarum]|uniref:hypothetical protein n=1 Tax=Rhizobium leguminosarum TaxID=384 RepID=UPI002E0E0F8D|nr:hypothetical protein U8Q02_37500 [Rhizobium leguminosarum]